MNAITKCKEIDSAFTPMIGKKFAGFFWLQNYLESFTTEKELVSIMKKIKQIQADYVASSGITHVPNYLIDADNAGLYISQYNPNTSEVIGRLDLVERFETSCSNWLYLYCS